MKSEQRLIAGSMLGHYRIIRLIGRGGMGEVYEAVNTKENQRVALKVISSQNSVNEEYLQRFKKEGAALSRINHPNVVIGVYCTDELAQVHYIVMEFVEGESLEDLIARHHLSMAEKIAIFEKLLEGVQALHQRGIIHRDLKARNVLCGRDGSVKILDLGIAKMDDDGDTALTKVGMVVGSVHYMSPELAIGKAASQQSDIWALGILFFQMLTGRLPNETSNKLEILHSIKTIPLTFKESEREQIPGGLRRIVLKMCNIDKDRRYQHIQDIMLDLEAWRKMGDTQLSQEIIASREKVPFRRYAFVALTLLIIVGAAAGYLMRFPVWEQPNRMPAESPIGELALMTPINGERVWILPGEEIGFSWQGGSRSDRFRFQVSTLADFSAALVDDEVAGQTVTKTFDREGLFYWRVLKGNSKTGPKTSFAVITHMAPETVAPKESQQLRTSDINLSWKAKLGVKSYRYQIARDKNFENLVVSELSRAPIAKNIHLDNGNFFWRVSVEDGTPIDGVWSKATPFEIAAPGTAHQVEARPPVPEVVPLPVPIPTPLQPKRPKPVAVRPPKTSPAPAPVVRKVVQAPKLQRSVASFTLRSSRNPSSTDSENFVVPVMQWKSVALASGYQLQIATDQFFIRNLKTYEVIEPEFKWHTVKPGKYYWRVRATNEGNPLTAYSDTALLNVTAELLSPNVLVPSDGSSMLAGPSDRTPIVFSWDEVQYAQAYEIQYSLDESFKTVFFKYQTNKNKYILKRTFPTGKVFWRLRAVGEGSNSKWSPPASFVIPIS